MKAIVNNFVSSPIGIMRYQVQVVLSTNEGKQGIESPAKILKNWENRRAQKKH